MWESADWEELVTSPVRDGERSERSFEVTADMVTHHVPDSPAVLTTPALIALLEETAADILRRRLAPGAAAVGTWINVRHRAPALVGDRVDVQATVADVRGRHVTFDVIARVGSRTIGDGQVRQALIRSARR
ncbi:MAG TPA: hotdog domain-containing protein [Micromonospora sp.]